MEVVIIEAWQSGGGLGPCYSKLEAPAFIGIGICLAGLHGFGQTTTFKITAKFHFA